MRYFVFAEDGNRYGPADVAMLNHWIEEGRLLPGMTLEEEGTHHRVAAASIAGLDFYVMDEASSSDSGAVAVIALDPPVQDPLSLDLFIAFSTVPVVLLLAAWRSIGGFLAVGLALLGMMAALKAKERGHVAANPALILNLIALVAWLAARLYMSLS